MFFYFLSGGTIDLNLTSSRQSKYESASQMAMAPTLLHHFDYGLAVVERVARRLMSTGTISVTFKGTVLILELDVVYIPSSSTLYTLHGVVRNSRLRGSLAFILGDIPSLVGIRFRAGFDDIPTFFWQRIWKVAL